MIYNFILNFFLKTSLIYILKSLFILFYIFNIFYKSDRVFRDRLNLIYYLYILFYNFIIIDNAENSSSFSLKENLFLEKLLYFSFANSEKIYLSPELDPLVHLVPKVSQDKENTSIL